MTSNITPFRGRVKRVFPRFSAHACHHRSEERPVIIIAASTAPGTKGSPNVDIINDSAVS